VKALPRPPVLWQIIQLRNGIPWLSGQITACNAPTATVQRRLGVRKKRKQEEKSAQHKAERILENNSSPDDVKAE
jgi:hypothetical protein